MREPEVSTVMTTDVVTVGPRTPFKDVARELAGHKISAVPVVDAAGRPLGVVSEGDLLAKQEFHGGTTPLSWLAARRHRSRRRKSAARTAADLMTSPVVTVAPTDSIGVAARTMAVRRVRRVFVVDPDGTLVGVVSRRDVLGAFLRPDQEIRAEVEARVLRQSLLLEPGSVEVRVVDGVVTLTGTVETRSGVELTCAVVQGMAGVVAVRNELAYQVDDLATTGL